MIDYKEIIAGLTREHIIEIFDKLDIPFIEKTTHFVLPTICHNKNADEASQKLYVYKDTWLFVCYTECGTMSIFNFLKKFYQVHEIDYDWYTDIYQVIVGDKEARQVEGMQFPRYKSLKERFNRKEKIVLPEFSSSVLDSFVHIYPSEWLKDNISPQAMDKYNIRYSISQNKIVIPYLDESGRLVGIRARALNPIEIEQFGKYAPIKIEKTWYSHPLSLNLYGLFYNKENIKKNGICYVFEAEKSVLQMESFKMDNCAVAVCGSNFNKFALKILLSAARPKEIVLCFDKEELPRESKYFDKLYAICEKYKNYCNFSFIYDRRGLLSLKDSPSDKGEEVFQILLNERVKVK